MVSKIHFQDTNIYQKSTFSLLTSSSLLIILHFIDAIQHLGKLNSVYIPLTLVGFEIVKLFIFGGSPPTPQSQPQAKWHWSIIKTTLLIVISVVCYFILAILYGAKAFTEHEETLMFAVHLTACTTIHCIANMGHKVFNTMLSKPSYGDEIILNSSQIVAVASLFGCWVSAVMIPLDWKRWWQKWPIPSVMGTFLGYICGFLVVIALAYFCNDKKVGQQRKKRCV